MRRRKIEQGSRVALALKAFILARISDDGVSDGYLVPSSIPAPIQQLAVGLPPRGTLASSPLTQQRRLKLRFAMLSVVRKISQ